LTENGKRELTEKSYYFKCPGCGHNEYMLRVEESEGQRRGQCSKCNEWFPEDQFETIEIEKEAYRCPICEELVVDSPENWSMTLWGGPEPVLVCPRDLAILRGYLHHENDRGAGISVSSDVKGGYQWIFHEDCLKKENDDPSVMELRRLCVDPQLGGETSRIVLVYQCTKCGKQQVIKHLLRDKRIWDAENKVWWINPKYPIQ